MRLQITAGILKLSVKQKGDPVIKRDFPKVHFYDQDFVDIYDKTWAWIQDGWLSGGPGSGFDGKFFAYPESPTVNQLDSIFSSFFLVYSNRIFQAHPALDCFYAKQESNGAIRSSYDRETGKAVLEADNPEGVSLPLFCLGRVQPLS